MSKESLSFRPNDEEYKHLEQTGKLYKWSQACHEWIEKDRKQTLQERLEKIQNSLMLIIVGILVFSFSYLLVPFNTNNFVIIALLFGASAVSVTVGAIYLLLELYIHGR